MRTLRLLRRLCVARKGRASLLCAAASICASFLGNLLAQSTSADEYSIRAAMLFNLTKFIDWPAWKMDPSHPKFLVCILGHDPIEPYADRYLQNQSVLAKPVQLRMIKDLSDAAGCHILYVSAGGKRSFESAAADLTKAGVLSVSERSVSRGSAQIIGLPLDIDHVQSDVNLGAAQSAGFAVSSKLLHLAVVTQ